MAAEARTRLMVVLFVDQVESTALLARLGDLEADTLRRTLEPILDESILEHDGRIVKTTGDGRMAVFDSASQAIDAGVAMHQRAARANRAGRAPAELRLRVGVSVGDVTEEHDDYHGTAVVEAARLESAASESGMLCSDLARSLAGNRSSAIFADRREIDAKGFPQPISAWVVTWEDEPFRPLRELPQELGAGARFGFVGRDDEFESARTAWKAAIDHQLTGVLVAGEPGVGKTRLARELALQALGDGATIVYGRCDEGVGAAFQPVAQALAHFVDHTAPSASDLGRFPGELSRLLPELPLLVPGLPDMVTADSDTEQYRLFDAVLSWLETMAGEDPVLLVVDDIQWAARPTLQLLRHLLRRSSDVPLCVLCT
ncbi:MAG TPA: adenylate/guanylate cyclase domain-containing protein [Ilumatobacteraceae bacterium]|nr:adenylate/guanylate cyclase domain-containing protein [Ilumatobacteraceae bacterium]